MTFRLPVALQTTDDQAALHYLHTYFGRPYMASHHFYGAYFDTWAPASDPDRFTADDLIAIKFLSVEASRDTVLDLLVNRSDEYSKLLADLGPDRDLVEVSGSIRTGWPGRTLMDELRSINGVGTTIASKLLARKRPRLRPIYDTVVTRVTHTKPDQWESMRVALRANDAALHHRLLRLRQLADLPETISAIRVLDVIAWREGKAGPGGRPNSTVS